MRGLSEGVNPEAGAPLTWWGDEEGKEGVRAISGLAKG